MRIPPEERGEPTPSASLKTQVEKLKLPAAKDLSRTGFEFTHPKPIQRKFHTLDSSNAQFKAPTTCSAAKRVLSKQAA